MKEQEEICFDCQFYIGEKDFHCNFYKEVIFFEGHIFGCQKFVPCNDIMAYCNQYEEEA